MTTRFHKVEDRPDGGLVYEVTREGTVLGNVRKRAQSRGQGPAGRRYFTSSTTVYVWDAVRPDGTRSGTYRTRAEAAGFLA